MAPHHISQPSVSRSVIGWLVLMGVISVIVFSAVSGGATATELNRTVNQSELAPGDSTNITVTTTSNETSRIEIIEEFDPAFANVVIQNATPTPTIRSVRDTNDSLAVFWENTTSATVTYQVTVSESADAGDSYTILSNQTNQTITIVSADPPPSGGGGSGAGGGNVGGGGSGGSSDDPEISIELFEFENSTTIRVQDIPQSSQTEVDTTPELSGNPFNITAVRMEFQGNPDDFRIEATDPAVDGNGIAPLTAEMGDAVGYFVLDFINADAATIAEAQVSVSVTNETRGESVFRDNPTMYQHTPDGWTSIPTELDNGTLTASIQRVDAEQFVLTTSPSSVPGSENASESIDSNESSTDIDSTESTENASSGETVVAGDSEDSTEESALPTNVPDLLSGFDLLTIGGVLGGVTLTLVVLVLWRRH